MASQTADPAGAGKGGGALGVGIALLVVGLLIGVGVGYLAAPRSQAPPATGDVL